MNDFSLTSRGSIFGFIGPSGSGKTTTIRMLTGVYTPTEGQVLVLERDPAKFNQTERARLGICRSSLCSTQLDRVENLNFAASLYGMSCSAGSNSGTPWTLWSCTNIVGSSLAFLRGHAAAPQPGGDAGPRPGPPLSG